MNEKKIDSLGKMEIGPLKSYYPFQLSACNLFLTVTFLRVTINQSIFKYNKMILFIHWRTNSEIEIDIRLNTHSHLLKWAVQFHSKHCAYISMTILRNFNIYNISIFSCFFFHMQRLTGKPRHIYEKSMTEERNSFDNDNDVNK